MPSRATPSPVGQAVRGAEVDPAGPGVQDPLRQRGDVLRRAGEREPVEHLVRDQRARGRVVAGRDQVPDLVGESGPAVRS